MHLTICSILIEKMSFLGIEELQRAEKIDFLLLNQGKMGLVFPCFSAPMVRNVIENMKYTTSIHIRKEHLGLLYHYLMFTTSHWNQDTIGKLEERVRIQAIEEECRKCIEHITGIFTGDLEILLNKLQLLSVRKSDQIGQQMRPHIPESKLLTFGEVKWLQEIENLYFKQIYQSLKFDSGAVKRFLDLHLGGRQLEKQVFMEVTGMEVKRLQQLLLSGLGLDLTTINASNYGLCAIASGAKSDYLPTFRDQMLFHGIGDSKIIEEFDQKIPHSKISKMEAYQTLAPLLKEPQKLLILGDKVASFLQNTKVYLLVLLYLLTCRSSDIKTQGWNSAIDRLLSKHLRYLCGTKQVGQYISVFFNQLFAYSFLLEELINLINSGKKL